MSSSLQNFMNIRLDKVMAALSIASQDCMLYDNEAVRILQNFANISSACRVWWIGSQN